MIKAEKIDRINHLFGFKFMRLLLLASLSKGSRVRIGKHVNLMMPIFGESLSKTGWNSSLIGSYSNFPTILRLLAADGLQGKKDDNGNIERNKAQLMVKFYMEKSAIQLNWIIFPIWLSTICKMLASCTSFGGWIIGWLDCFSTW